MMAGSKDRRAGEAAHFGLVAVYEIRDDFERMLFVLPIQW